MIFTKPFLFFVLSFIVSALISLVIFWILYSGLASLKPVDKTTTSPISKKNDTFISKQNKFNLLADCLIELQNSEVCEKKIYEKIVKLSKKKVSTEEPTNQYIKLIYILFGIALFAQINLFIISFINNINISDKLAFHISEWTINSAPILGVIGTILSFGLLINKSNGANLSILFNYYFYTAAITTIIGGFVYVFNLFLNIRIHSKFSD